MTTQTNHPDPCPTATQCDPKAPANPIGDDFRNYPDADLPNSQSYDHHVRWNSLSLTIPHRNLTDLDWKTVLYRPITPADGITDANAAYILRDPSQAGKTPPSMYELRKQHEKLRTFARRQREVEAYNEVIARAPMPLTPNSSSSAEEALQRAAVGLATLTETMVRKACLKEEESPAELDDEFLARLSHATTMLNRLANIQQKLQPRRPKPGRPRGWTKPVNIPETEPTEQ